MTNLVQPKPVPDFNLKLSGHDLWSKMGFKDGDALNEFVYFDPEIEAFDDRLHRQPVPNGLRCTWFERITLMALAEMFLIPKFDRPLTLYFANSLHNGVRVEEEEWWDWKAAEWPELPEVEVEARTVMDMLYSMQSVLQAWLDGRPVAFPACLKQTGLIFSALAAYPVSILDNQMSSEVVGFPAVEFK